MERAACDSDEAAIIIVTVATAPFGDVGSYAIHSADELLPDSVARQAVPSSNDRPHLIREVLGHPVDFQFLEADEPHPCTPETW
jgi:hypothetical protein